MPFGFIWLGCVWVFMFNDISLIGDQNLYPETAVTLTPLVFLFASLAIFLTGLLIGTMEMVVLEKRFTNHSLLAKIGAKFLIYFSLLFFIILITFPLAEAIEQGLSPFHPQILQKLVRFLGSLIFLNTALQLSFELFLSLIYSSISEHLGHNMLKNFFTGRYHTPKVEKRIFMFLDMKNSTSIAEKLGHVRYFDFLRQYYDALSDSIINHLGEVYQYVGDEIVITWEYEHGTRDNNWLECFIDLKSAITESSVNFNKEFGVSPDFRAGIHSGEVTTGEIGALKKEIVYTGDVLNTAARLQALCKEYNTDLIFSQELKEGISSLKSSKSEQMGEILLRGKANPIQIYSILDTK
ncbi:MAG: adenylate/guanylate cyclase domain-containing protein [Balneolaceae bacterium]